MDEFELIERFFSRAGGDGVITGVGDDGAVLEPPGGRRLVAVVDTLVEGIHYPADLAAADVGYRAVAVNLSDIAAMGAEPAWMTLALTLPAVDTDWLAGFAAGLYEAAGEHGVALVGGDTTRGGQTVISVQLLGHAAPAGVLTRSGCRPGDLLYVSGTLGDAAAGLESLLCGGGHRALEARFRRPAPRVALGQAVAGIAGAAIDVSDGLLADLGHVLAASGCGATLELEHLPLSTTLVAACGEEHSRTLALTGGDDYELCLAVPAAGEVALLAAARDCDTPVTRIGRARAAAGLLLTDNGEAVASPQGGYRHFAAAGPQP